MNKYVVPYYNNKMGIHVLLARSIKDCQDKLIELYDSPALDWQEFVEECKMRKIEFGQITDIDEL